MKLILFFVLIAIVNTNCSLNNGSKKTKNASENPLARVQDAEKAFSDSINTSFPRQLQNPAQDKKRISYDATTTIKK